MFVSMADTPLYLTVGEAAKSIGIATVTVHRWAKSGRLNVAARTTDNQLLFTEETVERAREAREVELAARATVA
jgi:excisionase family DNA binding protein